MNKTKFWNIARDGNVATIELFGDVWSTKPPNWYLDEVGEFDYISPETFRADLQEAKDADEVVVKINSCGGDAYVGIAIHNELKQLSAHKTVIIEGIAASAASVIAMAGDDVQMYPGSMLMIHGVSAGLFDWYNVEDLQKVINGMEACNKALAEIYVRKTGWGTEQVMDMLKEETWFTGEEAKNAYFADTLLEDEVKVAASADRKVLIAAGVRHDVSAFHLPESIRTDKRIHSALAGENKTTNSVELQEVNMTLEELREQSPELVNEIETSAVNAALEKAKEQLTAKVEETVAEAVKAERERLAHIDEISATINDPELVKEAKYGEQTLTAEQLAFEALKKQSAQGTAFLANMKADAADSKAGEVEAEPNAGEEEAPAVDVEGFVSNIVNVIKKEKGEN